MKPKKVKLFSAWVGVAGSAFFVRKDAGDTVGDMKDAIAERHKYEFVASKLQLYLAKKYHVWWRGDDWAVLQLQTGTIYAEIQAMIEGKTTKASQTLQPWLFDKNQLPLPTTFGSIRRSTVT